MATPSPVVVLAGFSLLNRVLLYASMFTAPASFIHGLGSNEPINAGFLTYTVYQQYLFCVASKHKQLHALSMLPPYLNTIYAITYFGGLSTENSVLSFVMCIGTIAALIINNITTWMAFLMNITEGYGVYRFWFLGWRTLSHQWHTFFLMWAMFDSFATVAYIGVSIYLATVALKWSKDAGDDKQFRRWEDRSLLSGSVIVFCLFAAWTELIVYSNHIVSATDWVSVHLFILQIVLTAFPSIYNFLCGYHS